METAAKKGEKLPQPLVTSLLAYGMQVANAYKKQTVGNLLIQEALGVAHLERLEKNLGDDSGLSAFLSQGV